MKRPETTGDAATDDPVVAVRGQKKSSDRRRIDLTHEDELAWHRAETDRLRVLIDFLGRPIHAPGGADPDPDVLTAYNLAVEAALIRVRRAALTHDDFGASRDR